MSAPADIPVVTIFGETGEFPDIVHCERIRDRAPDHGWVIPAHRHDRMHQIFQVETGHAQARLDGEALEFGGESFLFVPAQVVHSFRFAPGTDGYVLSLPLPVVRSFAPASAEAQQALARPVLGGMTGTLAALLPMFAAAFHEAGTFRAHALVGLAHAILAGVAEIGLARDRRAPPAALQRIERLDALIDAHMGEGWGPGDYAAAMSVTTGQLSRLCRAARGMNASAYVEAATMAEACRMLAFTRIPVADVGYRLGYNDPSYFSRRFRAVHGVPPSSYRARFVS